MVPSIYKAQVISSISLGEQFQLKILIFWKFILLHVSIKFLHKMPCIDDIASSQKQSVVYKLHMIDVFDICNHSKA